MFEQEDDHDHDHDLGDQLLALEDEPQKKGKKKRESGTLRKAPNAPKRFKSSYICFFMAKQPAIKEELGDLGTVTNISKRSAEMWKNISTEERAEWDDVAAKDKQRYMVEKAQYTGPWQVPWKRVKKDPSAPKRPMSAFLYFSQGKRSQIKNENPEIKNTEVSRILGELWRNLSAEERFPYVEQEKIERGKYKIATAAWREEHELKQEADRKMQEMQSELAMSETHPPFFLEPFGTQQVPMMNQYEFPGYQIRKFSGACLVQRCRTKMLTRTCPFACSLPGSCSGTVPVPDQWKAARYPGSQWNTLCKPVRFFG